jgi:hypothetical protein
MSFRSSVSDLAKRMNDRLVGFENKIADLIAQDLHAKIEYTWHPNAAVSAFGAKKKHARKSLQVPTCPYKRLQIPTSDALNANKRITVAVVVSH